MEVSKDELSKLMMVGRSREPGGPKPDKHKDNDKDKDKSEDKDKKDKGRPRRKGDAVNEVAAQEDTATTDAP